MREEKGRESGLRGERRGRDRDKKEKGERERKEERERERERVFSQWKKCNLSLYSTLQTTSQLNSNSS